MIPEICTTNSWSHLIPHDPDLRVIMLPNRAAGGSFGFGVVVVVVVVLL